MLVAARKALAAAWALTWIACTATPASAETPFVLGPPPGDGPIVVQAHFELRDINDIDDAAETFELGGVLELTWKDPRQAFDPAAAGVEEKIYQGAFQFNEMHPAWFPQVVLVNESGLFETHGLILRVKPDGTSTWVQTLDAAAEAEMDLHRYPFDRHRLDAVFEVLDAAPSEVLLEVGSKQPAKGSMGSIPQWQVNGVTTSIRESGGTDGGGVDAKSRFVVSIEVERESFFVVRLVVIPLMLIVMLSWSVFWMERAALEDRINVSFIGILTAVAYQTVKFAKPPFFPTFLWMTVKHGFFVLGLVITFAVFWQRIFGSIDVSLAMAVAILGVVAGLVSGVVNYMTISAAAQRGSD